MEATDDGTLPIFEAIRTQAKGESTRVPRVVYVLQGKDVLSTKLRSVHPVRRLEWGYGSIAVAYSNSTKTGDIVLCLDICDVWATPAEARAEFNRRRRAAIKALQKQVEDIQNLGQPVTTPI